MQDLKINLLQSSLPKCTVKESSMDVFVVMCTPGMFDILLKDRIFARELGLKCTSTRKMSTAYLIVCTETAIRDDGELFAKVTCVNIGHKVLITENIVRRAFVQQDPIWIDDGMVVSAHTNK